MDDNFYEFHDKNMTKLVELAQIHIDRVNQIYDQVEL